MKGFEVQSATEQVADRLREELLRGTWMGLMPGEDRLMGRLGIGRKTVREAIILLEEEGWLENRGVGRQRRITLPDKRPAPSLSVGILLYDEADRELPRTNLLRQRLLDAGHTPAIASRTLEQLGIKPGKVAEFVKRNPFDAWVVCSATSEILEWFVKQDAPAFALYGSFSDIPIAGVTARKLPKVIDLIQELADLGHRRIVNIARRERIAPKLGAFEQAFLDKLKACGIPSSDFNLPLWGPEPKGLHQCLDKLFAHTPPTAIYISEFQLFNATLNHLASRGILAPRDVTLICGEANYSFKWLETPPSHFDWNQDRIVQRVTQWVSHVAKGKRDLKQTQVGVRLVKGGTMGPPPKK